MAGRPKTFDPDAVLEVALDLFWVQGYEATGVRDLLDHMAISRQSLYDTYGNKYDLFLHALKSYDKATVQAIKEALQAPGSPRAHIRQMVRAWGDRVSTQPFKGCLVNNSAVELGYREPVVAQLVRDHWKKLEDLIKDTLDRAVVLGELQAETETRALARFLVSTAQGLIVLGKAGTPQETIQDVVKVTLQSVE